MSDTSTPPPPPHPITDLPEEERGRNRVWVYFLTGFVLLALVLWLGTREAEPPQVTPPPSAQPH